MLSTRGRFLRGTALTGTRWRGYRYEGGPSRTVMPERSHARCALKRRLDGMSRSAVIHRIADLLPRACVRPFRHALMVALAYGILGLTWVRLSDTVLFSAVKDPGRVARISALKGELFVVVTGIGLFLIAYAYLAMLERAEARYQAQVRLKDLALRQGYVDVLDAVTGGKFILVTAQELEYLLGQQLLASGSFNEPREISGVRREIRSVLESSGVSDVDEVILAVSEALTNAIKHAGRGSYEVRAQPDGVQVVVCDSGHGIDFRSLPKAALIQGFSTTSTLGLGFTIMLEVCDRVLLCTDEGGTTIVLEVRPGTTRRSPEPRLAELLSS